MENSDELMYELGRFAYTPASDLRFPMNSMQCNGAIWKAALDSLLDRADVVLMDLTGFCRENKGCLYEIQRLAESVPLSRLVLVVNDSTDIELVRETVIAAWSSAAIGNRTISQAPVCIRAVHIGKSAERAPTESLASWKQRAESGVRWNQTRAAADQRSSSPTH